MQANRAGAARACGALRRTWSTAGSVRGHFPGARRRPHGVFAAPLRRPSGVWRAFSATGPRLGDDEDAEAAMWLEASMAEEAAPARGGTGAPAYVGDTKCRGCGVIMQSEAETSLGFCPADKIGVAGAVCQRCFSLQHYGRLSPVKVPFRSFKSVLRRLYQQDCVLVQVLDAFDIQGSLVPDLGRLVGRHKPVILVLNKVDLLPAGASRVRLEQWVRQAAKSLDVGRVAAVHCVSSTTGEGVAEALRDIQARRGERNVYVIGSANAGKSTFVNRAFFTLRRQREQLALSLHADPARLSAAGGADPDWVRRVSDQGAEGARGARHQDSGALASRLKAITTFRLDDTRPLDPASPGELGDGSGPVGDPYARVHLPESSVPEVGGPFSRSASLSRADKRRRAKERKQRLRAVAAGREDPRLTRARSPAEDAARMAARYAARNAGDRTTPYQAFNEAPLASLLGDAAEGAGGGVDPTSAAAAVQARMQQESGVTLDESSLPVAEVDASTESSLASVVAAREVRPHALTASSLPGTTLGVVGLPLRGVEGTGQRGKLFDTPGLVLDEDAFQLHQRLMGDSTANLAAFLPSKRIRPVTYNLMPGRSLFAGALARVDYENPSGADMLFTWFGVLPLHATGTEKAAALWEAHAGSLLQPPADEETAQELGPPKWRLSYDLREVEPVWHGGLGLASSAEKARENRIARRRTALVDVVLGGMGWFAVTPVAVDGTHAKRRAVEEARITVHSVDGLPPGLRAPLMPFEARGLKSWLRE